MNIYYYQITIESSYVQFSLTNILLILTWPLCEREYPTQNAAYNARPWGFTSSLMMQLMSGSCWAPLLAFYECTSVCSGMWLTLLLPHGTAYFFLIRINNWKKEINACKFHMATSGFIGSTLWVFSPLFCCCDWSDLSVIPCSCGFICSPGTAFCDKRAPLLQGRLKVRLLCAGSSGLCNILLIQKLSWAL